MRFAVKFLGCKVSHADAMLARRRLLEAGHEEVPEEEAELHVVNTCCITSEAEAKSRQSVRRSLKTARTVYVGGCAVNLRAAQFTEIAPSVSAFTGEAEEVAQAMAGALGACADLEHQPLVGNARRSLQGLPGSRSDTGPPSDGAPPDHSAPATTGITWHSALDGRSAAARTRGFVKVQDGCDCHCAYCIIPTVRGPARSRPASAVLEEVHARVTHGQPEVVMTGISVGDYRDPANGWELGELMMRVARVGGIQRVRLSSVEVIHVRDSLIDALREEPKVCPHLHIPMQSGDDGVLRAMGRHYTAGEYLQAVESLRAQVPRVNLTTDIIVGFPNEDRAAFERTLGLVNDAGISRVHAFSYSPRPGTVAESLGDLVAPQEKKRRSQALRGLSEVRSRHHRATKLGTREQVLVDKVAPTQCAGYTADYTRCYLPAGAARAGELVEVRVREMYADGLRVTPC
ncbi:MAG TPA: MiaB/RimO family radical SAM methylthiotransferase [Solirubrobacteraceae bacterium]|jgi:threonylcarbamoyladenosine tRNA methylthiotransferase MtaB|nr:MiaB/RimO family radical SAM methylthiotransferase [Solirubrobacteraceae bacterium]